MDDGSGGVIFRCPEVSDRRSHTIREGGSGYRAVISKVLIIAEKRFKRLQAPEVMKEVYDGVRYITVTERVST